MQAIATKYLPDTKTKNSRIKARHNGGALTVTISKGSIPRMPNDEMVHRYVAEQLLQALDWEHVTLTTGGALDEGYVFVPVAK